MKVATPEQMREIDRTTIEDRGIPGIELMEQAGRAIAEGVTASSEPGTVVVFCGKGNNGGDGFVAARYLAEAGFRVVVIPVLGSDLKGDAKTAFDRLSSDKHPRVTIAELPESRDSLQELLDGADVLLDAMLGTGATPPLRDPLTWVVEVINDSQLPVVCADIPTGLDAETGEGELVVRAARTVTIGLPKLGMLTPNGVACSGNVWVEQIQFPRDLLESESLKRSTMTPPEAARLLPERPLDSHKGTYGQVGIAAGSEFMPGASVIAGLGALRSGTGLVHMIVPPALRTEVSVNLPEALIPGRTLSWQGTPATLGDSDWDWMAETLDAIVTGPGITTADSAREFLAQLLSRFRKPTLLDADALNLLAMEEGLKKSVHPSCLLTPHPGEMGRLLRTSAAEVQKDRWETVERAAREFGCPVLLKGFGTLVADPGGQVVHIPAGNTALSQGGTGDLLAGVTGGLMAQGVRPFEAAILGAYVCGLAADILVRSRSSRGLLVREIAEALPLAFRELEEKGRGPA